MDADALRRRFGCGGCMGRGPEPWPCGSGLHNAGLQLGQNGGRMAHLFVLLST